MQSGAAGLLLVRWLEPGLSMANHGWDLSAIATLYSQQHAHAREPPSAAPGDVEHCRRKRRRGISRAYDWPDYPAEPSSLPSLLARAETRSSPIR